MPGVRYIGTASDHGAVRLRESGGSGQVPGRPTYIDADEWSLIQSRLKRLAERIGQKALAKAIGIGVRTLRYLIAGRSPSAATQAKVIRLLRQNR